MARIRMLAVILAILQSPSVILFAAEQKNNFVAESPDPYVYNLESTTMPPEGRLWTDQIDFLHKQAESETAEILWSENTYADLVPATGHWATENCKGDGDCRPPAPDIICRCEGGVCSYYKWQYTTERSRHRSR